MPLNRCPLSRHVHSRYQRARPAFICMLHIPAQYENIGASVVGTLESCLGLGSGHSRPSVHQTTHGKTFNCQGECVVNGTGLCVEAGMPWAKSPSSRRLRSWRWCAQSACAASWWCPGSPTIPLQRHSPSERAPSSPTCSTEHKRCPLDPHKPSHVLQGQVVHRWVKRRSDLHMLEESTLG